MGQICLTKEMLIRDELEDMNERMPQLIEYCRELMEGDKTINANIREVFRISEALRALSVSAERACRTIRDLIIFMAVLVLAGCATKPVVYEKYPKTGWVLVGTWADGTPHYDATWRVQKWSQKYEQWLEVGTNLTRKEADALADGLPPGTTVTLTRMIDPPEDAWEKGKAGRVKPYDKQRKRFVYIDHPKHGPGFETYNTL